MQERRLWWIQFEILKATSWTSTGVTPQYVTDDTLANCDVTHSISESWDLHQQLPGHMLAAVASS